MTGGVRVMINDDTSGALYTVEAMPDERGQLRGTFRMIPFGELPMGQYYVPIEGDMNRLMRFAEMNPRKAINWIRERLGLEAEKPTPYVVPFTVSC